MSLCGCLWRVTETVRSESVRSAARLEEEGKSVWRREEEEEEKVSVLHHVTTSVGDVMLSFPRWEPLQEGGSLVPGGAPLL